MISEYIFSKRVSRKDMRIIAHLDLDAFFAQIEQIRLGLPETAPVVAQQWGGILAVNYPARSFGVLRSMNITEAKSRCSTLSCVHASTYLAGDTEPRYHLNPKKNTHKVSLRYYREQSSTIMSLVRQLSGVHETLFEQASVDECYIDLTQLVSSMAANKTQNNADWSMSCFAIPTSSDELNSKQTESSSTNELNSKQTESSSTNELNSNQTESEQKMKLACGIVARIRTQVYKQLGYTMSAGIARNKTLAKLGSAMNKPYNQTVILDRHLEAFLGVLEISKIRGLGGKMGDLLNSEFDVKHAKDLWIISESQLKNALGSLESAQWVHGICRGICDEPVQKPAIPKQLSAHKIMVDAVSDEQLCKLWIRTLCGELYYRVIQDEITNKRWPKSLQVLVSPNAELKIIGFKRTGIFPSMDGFELDAMCERTWMLLNQSNPFPILDIYLICGSFAPSIPISCTLRNFIVDSKINNRIIGQVCEVCNIKIGWDQVDEHKDFHVAMEMHREEQIGLIEEDRNKRAGNVQVRSSPKRNKTVVSKKSTSTSAKKTLADFFKIEPKPGI